jgi:propanol-preferring alcohol dehydrogenase
MKGKMQTAVVEAFGKPLVLRDYDIPTPGPGQILVKTEACGVCHTDLHAAKRLALEADTALHSRA